MKPTEIRPPISMKKALEQYARSREKIRELEEEIEREEIFRVCLRALQPACDDEFDQIDDGKHPDLRLWRTRRMMP